MIIDKEFTVEQVKAYASLCNQMHTKLGDLPRWVDGHNYPSFDKERLSKIDAEGKRLLKHLPMIEMFLANESRQFEEWQVTSLAEGGAQFLFTRAEVGRALSLAYHMVRNPDTIKAREKNAKRIKAYCEETRECLVAALEKLGLPMIPWELAKKTRQSGPERGV